MRPEEQYGLEGKPRVLPLAETKWNMTDVVTLGWTRKYAQWVIDLEWGDTPQAIREAVDELWERFSDFFRIVAFRLNVLNKGIDSYMVAKSGAGKSLAAYLLQSSLPGLVKVIVVPKAAWTNQKWTELNIGTGVQSGCDSRRGRFGASQP